MDRSPEADVHGGRAKRTRRTLNRLGACFGALGAAVALLVNLHNPSSGPSPSDAYSDAVLAGRIPEARLLCESDRTEAAQRDWLAGLRWTRRALGIGVVLTTLHGDSREALWDVDGAPGIKQAGVPARAVGGRVTFCPDPRDPLGVLNQHVP